jgi:hypothetical protein
MAKANSLGFVSKLLVGVLFLSLLVLPRPVSADGQHPHFPKPFALAPNVAFWKQVYTEHGVGDFVLHDRDNLGVVYAVVRVAEKTSQARAAQLAKAEIERVRASYRDILIRLAEGASAEELGAEGRAVTEAWGCPCPSDSLRRAAENIRVQQGLREKVDEGLRRAQGLLPKIVIILQRHDVPIELAALPMVESTFNPKAYSKAGAAGLWQFIRSTGKKYSLISRKRDDRRDPLRATEAAARLLRNNYQALGSWPLAIVAYNHGNAGIQAASAMVGSKAIEDIVARYDGPRFGFASKNFYAEFLAALDVVHPYLSGQGKSLQVKGRKARVQQASLPVQRPPAPALAPPAPPPPAAPVEAERPITPSVLPLEPSVGGEAAAPAEPVAASPSLGVEQPSDALLPPADPTAMEPFVGLEGTDVDTDLSTPPMPMLPDAADGDGFPREATLSEAQPADSEETVSP